MSEPPTPSPSSGPRDTEVALGLRRLLDQAKPVKPELYRYCRHLAGNPWDAEDLVQDTLARALVSLATQATPPTSLRAWLFRVASNLWIDEVRRRAVRDSHQTHLLDSALQPPPHEPQAMREAAGTLLSQLAPQERVAVVLKDAFGFELEAIADVLSTTVLAVKAALHRGRGKLAEPNRAPVLQPSTAGLEAFCTAFNSRDLSVLTSLLLDNATVEVVGATVLQGAEKARTTVLWGMLFGSKYMASDADGGAGQRIEANLARGVLPSPARLQLMDCQGAPVFLSWYEHHDGEFVRAVTRLVLSEDGARVARLRNYFYTPEVIAEVCDELGLPHRENGIYLPGDHS